MDNNTDCKFENDLVQMKDDVREIRNCLLGTPFTENKGVVHRINTLEKLLEKLKQEQNYKTGFAAAVGTFIGGIIGFLINILIP